MSRSTITDEDENEHTFLALKGEVQGIGQTVADISRPGVDGHEYRREGKRGRPFDLVGIVDADDNATASTMMTAFQNMRGTLVKIEDDHGAIYNDVMVLDVVKESQRPIGRAVGGLSATAQTLLAVRFTLQKTN